MTDQSRGKYKELLFITAALGMFLAFLSDNRNAVASDDAASLISPEIPSDIDIAVKEKIEVAGAVNWKSQAHQLFERHAWQTMVALQWPLDGDGSPMASLSDNGLPRWAHWLEVFQIFKADGSEPDPWGTTDRTLPEIGDIELPREDQKLLDYSSVAMPQIGSREARVLHNVSSVEPVNVLDEVNQAFSSAVWDQNGNMVHYEILINDEQYQYIIDNQLYNIEGQVEFFRKQSKLDFPIGRLGTDQKGAIELKLAWKILDPAADDRARYITMPSYIPAGDDPTQWQPALMGLVGFHIAQKTESSPQWIWSTFEHVDNLEVDLLETVNVDGEPTPLRPSFYDPDCQWCPVNIPPEPGADGERRTQVIRLLPIRTTTQRLNTEMRAVLEKINAPLQYYQLVGVQWPLFPAMPPAPRDDFPASVFNKSGGYPFPTYLINSVMETYSQKGNLPANQHHMATTASDRLVFGTSSCMGCHASAPNDDFSWIMTKAQPKRLTQ